MAAGDVDQAARLVTQLWLPAYWAGRRDTLERWVLWLDQQHGIRAHPVIAVMAAFLYTVTGRPVETERWADLVDRWQYHEPGWAGDPATEAFPPHCGPCTAATGSSRCAPTWTRPRRSTR